MGKVKKVAIGAAGGLAGAALMGYALAAVTKLVPDGRVKHKDVIKQGIDATEKVANAVTTTFTGHRLSQSKRKLGGQVVHFAFGASMGALYALLADKVPGDTASKGALFGGAVYLGAHSLAVPALGLAPSPVRNGPTRETPELVAHLAYGIVTETVRRALS